MHFKRQLLISLHEGAMEQPARSIDRPQRLVNAMSAAGKASHGGKLLLPTRKATIGEMSLAHDEQYLQQLKQLSTNYAPAQLDPGLIIDKDSFAAAAAASGAMLDMLQYHCNSPEVIPFCLSRPGSHHAGLDYALGFCLVNNLAVTAAFALENDFADKVAILDFDVHHGNGTQEIFANDDRVMTISLHQYPFYPGTGSVQENTDTNHNYPLAADATEQDILSAYKDAMAKINGFAPQLILLEAGMDGHAADPNSDLQITDQTFFEFGRELDRLLDQLRCATIIEAGGGYTQAAMENGMGAFLGGLL